MAPEIANDKQLRQDYDYDVSADINKDELDVDDEYAELSGVVGRLNLCFTSKNLL